MLPQGFQERLRRLCHAQTACRSCRLQSSVVEPELLVQYVYQINYSESLVEALWTPSGLFPKADHFQYLRDIVLTSYSEADWPRT